VFPLEERYFYSYEDTWGTPRTQGGHEGTDLMAPAGAPEYAVTDGTVVPVAGSNENGWHSLGGYAVMVRADYSVGLVKAGDLFYYAHLGRPCPLKIGTRVRAGQVIGYSGDTGQGPEVTRGLFPAHLHLGWYDVTGSRSEADSGAMNPYPLLEWIKANGGAVTGGTDARYCEAPSPPTPIPSTGQGDWPAPEAPGVRPDRATGSSDPSPVVQSWAHARTIPIERGAPTRHRDRVPQDQVPGGHAPQERIPRERPRDATVKPPDTERPEIPESPVPEPPDPNFPEPRRPEIPPSDGATPSRGRASPNAA
jgi:collagen type III alpha